jgi:ribose-phosphate pyrophosphokinase
VIDDEIANGGSMLELLARLRERGARTYRLACTHGLFAKDAVSRLAEADDVLEIVATNTMPNTGTSAKLTILSVAPLFAEALRRIHNGESLTSMFPGR